MTITLTNDFGVDVELDRAWSAMSDIPFVAGCLPGATVQSQTADDVYEGTIGVKVGPVNLFYAGTAEVLHRDDARHELRVRASGRDSRGQGSASAVITVLLAPRGDGTHATVRADLDVTGKVAQLGKGMLQRVSTRMVAQFAANLQQRLASADQPQQSGDALLLVGRRRRRWAAVGIIAVLVAAGCVVARRHMSWSKTAASA